MIEKFSPKCERCHDNGLADTEKCKYRGLLGVCKHPNGGLPERPLTVLDLTKQMRGDINDSNNYPEPHMWRKAMSEYAWDIEAAYEREIDELTAAEHGGVIVNGAVRGLNAQVKSLRAALAFVELKLEQLSYQCLELTQIRSAVKDALKGEY